MFKLNDCGWGFVSFLAYLFLFFLALLMILYTVNDLEDGLSSEKRGNVSYSEYEVYNRYEETIEESAMNYKNKNNFFEFINILDLDVSETIKTKCSGYVRYDYDSECYNAYIKCGSYETSGYNAQYE